jgi:hypothetical protein
MLSIIATLKEFWSMLLKDIHIFMEHKNLMLNTLEMQYELR